MIGIEELRHQVHREISAWYDRHWHIRPIEISAVHRFECPARVGAPFCSCDLLYVTVVLIPFSSPIEFLLDGAGPQFLMRGGSH